MKLCRNCNEEKELKDFYKTKNRAYPDSLLHHCKVCISEYRKHRRIYVEKPSFKVEKKEIIFSFD
jgi:hypothetical protein